MHILKESSVRTLKAFPSAPSYQQLYNKDKTSLSLPLESFMCNSKTHKWGQATRFDKVINWFSINYQMQCLRQYV